MRTVTKPLALGLLSLTLAAACLVRAAAPVDPISLMQTLSEWAYPGTMEPGVKSRGASMSDGGNPLVRSVQCEAVLATPDPVEKVVAFYEAKFKPGNPPGPKDARALSIQDDSAGRPLTLRVLVVNRAETSTTLVISRAEGEKETHIAWSHYIRLGDAR